VVLWGSGLRFGFCGGRLGSCRSVCLLVSCDFFFLACGEVGKGGEGV